MISIELFQKLRLLFASFNWGAICFVSVVHYPLFADVSVEHFTRYHKKHVSRTSLLLGTTLSLEMLLNVFGFFVFQGSSVTQLPLLFLMAGWLITFLVSVPQHRKLETGFCSRAHQILMLSNWARVICWGGAVITAMLFY